MERSWATLSNSMKYFLQRVGSTKLTQICIYTDCRCRTLTLKLRFHRLFLFKICHITRVSAVTAVQVNTDNVMCKCMAARDAREEMKNINSSVIHSCTYIWYISCDKYPSIPKDRHIIYRVKRAEEKKTNDSTDGANELWSIRRAHGEKKNYSEKRQIKIIV